MKNTEFNLYTCLDTIAECLSNGMDDVVAQSVIETYDIKIEEITQFKDEYCFSVFEDYHIIKQNNDGEWDFYWNYEIDDEVLS